MKNYSSSIGHIIRELRVAVQKQQGVLADECGITQTYLSQIENGKKEPSSDLTKRICKGLGIPYHAFLFLAMDEEDVPEAKRLAYRSLAPTIESLIKSIFLSKSE
jgi:transcriptional regulator with XRE-family HTH domain